MPTVVFYRERSYHLFYSPLYVEHPLRTTFIRCKYADDVLGCMSPTNQDSSSLQHGLEDLMECSSSKSFTLTASKCNDIIFSFLRDDRLQSLIAFSPTPTVKENSIPRSSTVKYVDNVLSQNLSWSTRVCTTC
ncbi:unnamed protein product, partial [Dicrocoelium dendriticum]